MLATFETILFVLLSRDGSWTGSYGMASLRDYDANEPIFWKASHSLFFFFSQTQLAVTPTFNKLKKQLDREEDPWRRRRRLVRNYNGTTHPEATIGGRPMSPSIETPSTTGVDLSVAAHAVKFAAHIDHFDAPVTEVEIEEVGTKENSPCLSTNQAIPFFSDFLFVVSEADEAGKSVVSVPCDLVKPGYVLSGTLTVTSNPAQLRFQGDSFKDPVLFFALLCFLSSSFLCNALDPFSREIALGCCFEAQKIPCDPGGRDFCRP